MSESHSSAHAPMADTFADTIETHRRTVWGAVYRITGSADDADEIVQETWTRALERAPAAAHPERSELGLRPWLLRVATNLALDRLRARQRTAYTGPWLPQPTPGLAEIDGEWPDARYARVESATLAFLLALEALSPAHRAVLVLRDVLDLTTAETADALALSEANVKTSLHRARKTMAGYDEARLEPASLDRHRAVLGRFVGAVMSGDLDALRALVTEGVTATTDAGGDYSAATRTVLGADAVSRFFLGIAKLSERGPTPRFELVENNGVISLVALRDPVAPPARPRFAPVVVMSFDLDGAGRIRAIYAHQADAKVHRVRAVCA